MDNSSNRQTRKSAVSHISQKFKKCVTCITNKQLYKTYKKETGNEPWQLPKAVINMSAKPQASDFKPITFDVKPDPELIIRSVLKHFTYLKFRNSFRGIDNYNFASPQPWSSPCPICNGKHGNYGLHGEWYGTEYCLTCFTSSNKFKFAIVA